MRLSDLTGKAGTATVKLAAGASADAAKKPDESQTAKELSNLLGVKFRPIEDADRRRYDIPGSVRGVVVQQIETGSDRGVEISGDVSRSHMAKNDGSRGWCALAT